MSRSAQASIDVDAEIDEREEIDEDVDDQARMIGCGGVVLRRRGWPGILLSAVLNRDMDAADDADEDRRPVLTREFVVELYHDRGLSISEIAAETGWSRATVWNWLDSYDIETRDQEQSKYHDLDDELLEYIDWLTPKKREDLQAIAIEKRGITEQAQRRGVEPIAVQQVLRRAVDRLETIAEEQE